MTAPPPQSPAPSLRDNRFAPLADAIHAALAARFPALAAPERITIARAQDGVAHVVIDATGLDTAAVRAADAIARDAAQAAAPALGLSDVRIGLTAERGAASASPRRLRKLAVGSGKGGVGKSTLSANLAVALAARGLAVGLVDADIYGPSQPRLLGTEGRRPEAQGNKLFPVASPFGVPMLSMGHLVSPGQAIAWRGPMAGNALGQLIDADWGTTELLVIDLPPGTGDIQLTMLQKHKPDAALIVSTPQDLALIDAERAMGLFATAAVPLLGMVENMAGYLCPHCGQASDPFGHGGAELAARERGLPFLGRIPLAMDIRLASDAGEPPAAGAGPIAEAFGAIAARVIEGLAGV